MTFIRATASQLRFSHVLSKSRSLITSTIALQALRDRDEGPLHRLLLPGTIVAWDPRWRTTANRGLDILQPDGG